jgi:hypothetical protein
MNTYQWISSIIGILGFLIAIGNLVWNFLRDRERFEFTLEKKSGLYGPMPIGVIRNIGNCPVYLEKIIVCGPNPLPEQVIEAADQQIGAKQNFKFELERYINKTNITLEVYTKSGKVKKYDLKKLHSFKCVA